MFCPVLHGNTVACTNESYLYVQTQTGICMNIWSWY